MASPPTKPPRIDPNAGWLQGWTPRARRLLIVAMVALVAWLAIASWAAWELWNGGQQKGALAMLKNVAGSSFTWSGRVRGVRMTGVGDAELKELASLDLPDLKILQLTDCQLSNTSVTLIAKFDQLVELNLRGTPLEITAVDTLKKLKTLEKLDVTRCGLPYASIEQLNTELPKARIVD